MAQATSVKQTRSFPLVTVAIPVFNGARYLPEALDAHLAQDFTDFEIIVLDNASTDATPSIVQTYVERDERVRSVRHERNIGLPQNFNAGVPLARGTYFRWAAHDDLVAPTSLARCVEVLETRPDVVMAYPKTILIDRDGAEIGPYDDNLHCLDEDPVGRLKWVMKHLQRCNAHYGLLRTSQLRRTGLLASFPGADRVMYRELALWGKFFEIQEKLFFRRMYESASSSMSDEQLDILWQSGRHGGAGRRNILLLSGTMAAVWRAPLRPGSRVRAFRYVVRRAISQRTELWQDLASLIG